ncbi:UNVERIFIED_CONTAM: hypothetical protein PYX00_000445 [Menopon gallinae]|uniref:Maspardin n=1 Tax=Menopon gallinae TaxID=328185 RepID=A0AAW2IA15_9NEOP
MNSSSDLSQSREYLSFRSCIPLRKIIVDSYSSKGWKIYDAGPKTITTPLVCLPPVSGTADVYYKQLMSLSAKGYRIISAEHPPYWNIQEWCEGFKKLMDQLGLVRVHLFGASLGGYLAQKFAEHTFHCQRVASLILCNSFVNTSIFNYTDTAALFHMLPSMILKKMVMGNFPQKQMDKEIADSVDFMVEKLESLTQQDLASRLTINCLTGYVDTYKINSIPVTITDVFDEYALSSSVREEMYKCYPHAKLAHLKSGGNFPYLSRSDEINLHLQIHLRPFNETPFSALDSS